MSDDSATKSLTAFTDATNPKGITTTVNIVKLRVKDLPPPNVTINGVRNETISLVEFKTKGELIINSFDDDPNIKYQLVKYQFMIRKKNGELVGPIDGSQAIFNNQESVRTAISKAESGDRVYITDIIATDRGGNHIQVGLVSAILE